MNTLFAKLVGRDTPCAPILAPNDGAHGVTRPSRQSCAIGRLLLVISVLVFALSLPAAAPAQKAANEIPPLAPPLPEIQTTFWERHPALKFALPGLATGLALGLWQAWVHRKKTPPQIPAPADQARAALVALQARPEDGAMLGEVATALRRYLIAAFWLPPVEATTAEFCATLKANPHVGPELSWAVGELLMRCDERKFSPAANPAAIGAARRALELVDMAEVRRTQPHAPAAVLKPA